MNLKRWKIGIAIAIGCGLLNAGAGLLGDMSWQSFVAVLCSALLTNLMNWLAKHPIESIVEDTAPRVGPGGNGNVGLFFAFACVALMFAAVGCTTSSVITNNPDGTSTTNIVRTVDPVRAQKISKFAAGAGSRIAIAVTKRPELREDFNLAANAIDGLLLAGDFNAQSLREVLAQIDVKPDEDIWLIAETFLEAYDVFAADVVTQKLDAVQWLAPILRGVRDGLRSATSPPAE
jgi:hypothetical protein